MTEKIQKRRELFEHQERKQQILDHQSSVVAQKGLLSPIHAIGKMASTLKLVGPATFRAFRCLWMLEEVQVPYEHIAARPWSKLARKNHPQGKIPILLDGDFLLYESAAINTYLGDKFQSPLVPSPQNTRERALYNQFILSIMIDMDAQGLWIHRKHEVLSEYFGKCPKAVEEAKRQFDKVQAVLVSQLSKPGPYLLGKDFTAVDILYVHCLDWAFSVGWFEPPTSSEGCDGSALRQYLDLCKSRSAYKRTVAIRNAEEEITTNAKSKI